MKKLTALLLASNLMLSMTSCDFMKHFNDLKSEDPNIDITDEKEDRDEALPPSSDETAMQMYEAAIKGEICVMDERLGEIKLKACRFPGNNLRLDESIIEGKVILDMDGDEVSEYVIFAGSGDSIILHYHDGKVYAYSFCFEQLYNLNTDGSFYWSEHESGKLSFTHGSSRLSFYGEQLRIKEQYKIVNYGEPNADYYIDGRQVTYDEFRKYFGDNSSTPVETTPFQASWQKTIPLEQALEIATGYWYDLYHIKPGDRDSETGFPYAILPKYSNNGNYCIALAWLVEGTHYSTVETIEINAMTGEIILPDSASDGK